MLLGHAVHGAEAPDEIPGIDGDNFAGGKKLGQRVEGDAIVGAIENGREHDTIRDIEIGIAGGQAAAFKNNGLRHGEIDNV